jgi:ADP-ribose pyrophosphatase YjhB (NUDIX family)
MESDIYKSKDPVMFNIRVYGILINEDNKVLLSDEFIRGNYFTKFPGGGLEFGEGTRDCLKREFMEETGLEIEVSDHIYTTDYFQLSAFNPSHQIISIYYFVKAPNSHLLVTKDKPFDFSSEQTADSTAQDEVFRWIDRNDLTEEHLSLPIDKKVVSLLRARW